MHLSSATARPRLRTQRRAHLVSSLHERSTGGYDAFCNASDAAFVERPEHGLFKRLQITSSASLRALARCLTGGAVVKTREPIDPGAVVTEG